MVSSAAPKAPEVGQAVRVRNRLATVRAVEAYDSRTAQGRLHVVDVEYLDDWRYPEAEQLLWEVEATATVLGTTSLPGVDANRPDSPAGVAGVRQRPPLDPAEPPAGERRHRGRAAPRRLELGHPGPRLPAWSRSSRPWRCPASACSWPTAWAWARRSRPGWSSKNCSCGGASAASSSSARRCSSGSGSTSCGGSSTSTSRSSTRTRPSSFAAAWASTRTPGRRSPASSRRWTTCGMPDVLRQFLQASGAGPDAEAERRSHDGPRPVGSADRGRVPPLRPAERQPGQPADPDAPGDPLPVRAPHLRLGHPAQRQDRLLHRPAGTARPDPVPDDRRDGRPRTRRTWPRSASAASRTTSTSSRSGRRSPSSCPRSSLPLQLSPQEIGPLRRPAGIPQAGPGGPGPGLGGGAVAGPVHLLAADQAAAVLPVRLRPDVVAAPGGRGRAGRRASLFDMARVSAERAEEQAKSDDERSRPGRGRRPLHAGPGSAARAGPPRTCSAGSARPWRPSGYDRKTVEDPGKLAALARKSDSKTDALVRWVKEQPVLGRQAPGRRAADRLHRVQGDAVLPGAAAPAGRVRQEHAAAALRRHERRRVRGREVRVRGPDRRRAAAAGDRRRLRRHQHAGVLPLGHPLRHPVVALQAPAAQRACLPPRPGAGRERPLLPLRPGGGHGLPLPTSPRRSSRCGKTSGSVERIFDAAIQRHFQGKPTSIEQIGLFVDAGDRAAAPRRPSWARPPGDEIADLTRRARELLESTDARLGISPQALVRDPPGRHRRRGPGVAGGDHGQAGLLPAQAAAPVGGPGPADAHGRVTHRPHGTGLRRGPGRGGDLGPAGPAAQEASGPDAAGPPDHAAGDGDPLPPAARPDRPRPDLPLVGGGPAPDRLRGPAGLPLHGHGHQRTAGAAARRGGLPRSSASRATGWTRSRTTSSRRAAERVPPDQVRRRGGTSGSARFRGQWFQHRSELEAFLGDQEKPRCRACCRPGPTPP